MKGDTKFQHFFVPHLFHFSISTFRSTSYSLTISKKNINFNAHPAQLSIDSDKTPTPSLPQLQIPIHQPNPPNNLPWLFSPPRIISSLTRLPKTSTLPTIFRKHSQEIIHSFIHSPIQCYVFTDCSKSQNKSGFAFTIGNSTVAHRHRDSASVLVKKLQAIFNCLQQIHAISHPTPKHPLSLAYKSSSVHV